MKKITSMKMPHAFTLAPTRQDVLAGVCNSPTKCMYARCGRRLFPGVTYFGVNPNGVTITYSAMYYHYGVPKKAVAFMARYDQVGKNLTDAELKKAKVTLTLVGVKPSGYTSTEATREYHRKKSAKRRADPDYVRPDSRNTLRAQVARTFTPEPKV